MTITKDVKYSSIESVTYSFDEVEIRGALVALIEKIYSIDVHFRAGEFEIGYDEDGHVVASLVYDYTTEVKDGVDSAA